MMRRTSWIGTAVLAICSMVFTACAPPSPVLPTITQVPTASFTPIPTSTPPPTLTATITLEPTPVPGAEVYPPSSLGRAIPWLPYDESKKPMSVYYGFNVAHPPFDNVLVRQAFAAAIDREQVAQKALGYYFRNAVPATSLTPPEVLSRDLYNTVGIPFDPTKAKDLLQQAGYPNGEGFPTATLLVSTRGKGAPGAYYQMAKLIVNMWQANLGVTVQIEVASIPDYPNRFITDPPDIYQLGWVADYNDPDNFLNALFHSRNKVNFGHFDNSEFDRIVEEAARLADPEERLLLYIQAEQILTEREAGAIPLYHCYVPIPYVY